jgi:hypothetical protein
MSIFNVATEYLVSLMKKRDELNAKRSAWFREEGAGVCLDKDYRLLCKEINSLRTEISSLSSQETITF